MNTADETAPDALWPITELEVAARDLLDLGIWETAEEEEVRAVADGAPGIPAYGQINTPSQRGMTTKRRNDETEAML